MDGKMRGIADQSIAVDLHWNCVFSRVALISQPTTVPEGLVTARYPQLCVSFAALLAANLLIMI